MYSTSARFILIQNILPESAYACAHLHYLKVLIVYPASLHLRLCHLDIKSHPFKNRVYGKTPSHVLQTLCLALL